MADTRFVCQRLCLGHSVDWESHTSSKNYSTLKKKTAVQVRLNAKTKQSTGGQICGAHCDARHSHDAVPTAGARTRRHCDVGRISAMSLDAHTRYRRKPWTCPRVSRPDIGSNTTERGWRCRRDHCVSGAEHVEGTKSATVDGPTSEEDEKRVRLYLGVMWFHSRSTRSEQLATWPNIAPADMVRTRWKKKGRRP